MLNTPGNSREIRDLVPVNGAINPVLAGRVPMGDTPSGFKREYAGLLEYWQMIRRHKAPVVLATLLGLAIGFLLTLPEPRIYQARTTLEIQGLNDEFLNMRNVNPTASSGGGGSPEYEILTQVKIIQSRSLLKRVVAKLETQRSADILPPPDRVTAWRKAFRISPPTPDQLWRQAVGTAAGSVKVKASGTNRIVEVSCDSTSPKVAAQFLNTLTEEFIEQNLEARWKSTEHTGEWLTKQLQDLKIKLERSEDQLQSYARATGLVITAEKNADDTKLVDVQKQLSEAEADRVNKQSKFELAAASPLDAMPDVLDDSGLQDTQKTLVDLKRQLAQLRVTFTPNHTDVKRIESQINLLESSLT
jgi:succinoglycan biosynthesis transport protein ExoP